MRNLQARLCIASAALFALAACSKEPINLPADFTPPEASLTSTNYHKKSAPDPDVCHVMISTVLDKRTDKDSNGLLGWRVVHYADTAAWMRSGLQSLNRDKRILISDKSEDSDLVLDIDILKVYVINITTDKSANVVVRVHYSRGGVPLGDQVIRGVETGWNWANGSDETESAFDDALEDMLKSLDQDIESRCHAPSSRTAGPPPAATAQAQ